MKRFSFLVAVGFLTLNLSAAQVGNFVWEDSNGNGLQDIGEPGIDGVTVQLFRCADTNFLASTITTNGGTFLFQGDFADPVFLQVIVPNGFVVSALNVGLNDALDSGFNPLTLRTGCIAFDCTPLNSTACFQINWDLGLFRLPTEPDGTGSPGFWKNHLTAWPIAYITVAGITYSANEANALISNGDDKSLTMFRSVVAARLNQLVGNQFDCIDETLRQAELWLVDHPRGSSVDGDSDAWKAGEDLHLELDAYNNGRLCAAKREGSRSPVSVRPGGVEHGEDGSDRLRLRFFTYPGQIFTVQESTDLVEWISIGTVTNYFGIAEFLAIGFERKTNAFYRVVVFPGQTVLPINVYGTFLELENDQRVHLLPIVYNGDLVIRGNNNEIIGAGVGQTVIAGNVLITGNANLVRDLTILGTVTFRGNENTLQNVDYQGAIEDPGNGNNAY